MLVTSPKSVSMKKADIEKLIEERFGALSPQLRKAARYAISHSEDIALQSMRSVAAKVGVHPTAMIRFARELGLPNYESFREPYRSWLSERYSSFSTRAQELRRRPHGDANGELMAEIARHEIRNLDETFSPANSERISAAHAILASANRAFIVGLRSLHPAAFYFHYVCRMFTGKTVLLTGVGGTFADDLRRIRSDDALVAFSYHPYAKDAVRAVDFAHSRGARIVSITDNVLSPIASKADALIVVSNNTPSLFPSVIPALAVAQALVALLVANSSEETLREIANSEAQLQRFNVFEEGE
jgi:DNA-binding MurR/RpiR family transcriptional regulator